MYIGLHVKYMLLHSTQAYAIWFLSNIPFFQFERSDLIKVAFNAFGFTVFMNKSRFTWSDCHEGILYIEDV